MSTKLIETQTEEALAAGPLPCSVVVPTRNRPLQLAECLRSLAALDFGPGRFEVIVVDDGGAATLEPVVAPFQQTLNLTLVRQDRCGPAAARNAGAAQARGRYLVFTDDDCTVRPDWLSHLYSALVHAPETIVGGVTINRLAGNPYATASQQLVSHLYNWYSQASNSFVTSNNMAISADSFRLVGGFDEGFPMAAGEDREFCDRWTHRGNRIVYASEPIVYHSNDLTLRAFLRQHFSYGRGAYHFHRIRAERWHEGFKIERARFYTQLLRYPFGRGDGPRALVHVLLLALSQLLNAGGFFWEAAAEKRPGAGRPRSET